MRQQNLSKMSKQLIKVFVYGTLKQGEPNHHWISSPKNGLARFVNNGTTSVKFPLVIGTRYNIPFLLNKPGEGHNVQGEIYEIDEQMLGNLDILEDYPRYYDREIQAIITDQNDTVECWLYLIRNYPEKLLSKPHLNSYHNTPKQPYSESYADSTAADLFTYD
ncbi:putative gamma-glutamylcyclotransferase CG2811 isoform X2 [Scaptodrosophila lebanonensis]|uniref:Gamma-glutamylcyclotransferase family protein n=1 Tax=Drosophila lebanonensis TaxID=7225 RepID=A0A6J2TD88_DROLE|nr:putative gamma-glutamylcyclotransferase CG2811 isoform X2 [Scaptodrosophila lebanonensis]